MKNKETLEEAAKKLINDFPVLEVRFNMSNEEIYGWFLEALQKGAKWQQEQDKNKYSEEDLKQAFNDSRKANIFEENKPPLYKDFEEWFKQLKDK